MALVFKEWWVMQIFSTIVFVIGILVLINAATWPVKVIGVACLLVGFFLDKRIVRFFKKSR